MKQSSAFSPELIENTALSFKRRLKALQADPAAGTPSPASYEDRSSHLKQRLLNAERGELERLRQEATIHDAIFFQLNWELDIEETLLQEQRV